MKIETVSLGEAVALAAAVQRLSPTPVEPGEIPMPRGDAVNHATRLLAEACLNVNPFGKWLGEGIASGTIAQRVEPEKVKKPKKRVQKKPKRRRKK